MRFIAKAAASDADVVLLDLEDAVAHGDKAVARATVVEALNTVDFRDKTVSVRVNAFDTPFMHRDILAIAHDCPRLDLLMAPKVESAADVHFLDLLLNQIEMETGRARPIGLELQIETARGLQNVAAIAAAGPRVESLHFGPGDFAASMGARTTSIGGAVSDYGVLPGPDAAGPRVLHLADPWHHVLAAIVVAARAAGVRPIDGPYADFKDEAGLRAAALRSAALGFDGKWAIHPSQIDAINAAFTPTDEEVRRAAGILAALDAAQAEQRGAVTFEGRMIDAASARQARVLLEKHARDTKA